ncbi:hypothetical protein BX661DRAFT_184708 [Kickxella alabastrina]|uniref:uncharacterized protein n=1 Tax=Kickxella alabastrina TaxID=61397 RepID=UPI0022209456|nr:uncharacterized protein BX661DRAFT_184708 [Kickxella alabastrina]KAI7825510.1 hypothetical protein BX661DRAFT_184708 [Kickxella alabastrina]
MRISVFQQASVTLASLVVLLTMSSAAKATLQSQLSSRKFSNAQFSNALSGYSKGRTPCAVLVPRQIGSPGYRAAQGLIVDTLGKLGYAISWDNFTASTPAGNVKMANIIATHNPGAAKRLVLSAHYESKIMMEGDFVGATDSAVPVALMLDVARGLADKIDQLTSRDLSLQLIFFDGEEAYHEWTTTDSIYGARHLADSWEKGPDSATVAALSGTTQHVPELQRVELMVLLDLIGASTTAFVALELPTADLFIQLGKLEKRLHSAGHISRTYMDMAVQPGSKNIADDHIPFVQRDIPVMHLISVPFPEALDPRVIADMSIILRSFVASYMRLSV